MDNPNKIFEQAEFMTRLWTDFAGKMAAAGFTVQPGDAPPDATRQMRGAFFQAMAQSIDEYMRSPQFLGMMKQSMDAAVSWRKQMNELLNQWHHELQGPTSQDIDTVMIAIRHLETRVLGRVEELSQRLDDAVARLEAAAGGAAQDNGSGELKRPGAAPPAPARKAPKKQD